MRFIFQLNIISNHNLHLLMHMQVNITYCSISTRRDRVSEMEIINIVWNAVVISDAQWNIYFEALLDFFFFIPSFLSSHIDLKFTQMLKHALLYKFQNIKFLLNKLEFIYFASFTSSHFIIIDDFQSRFLLLCNAILNWI
jgi:hypothetical protein